MEEKIIVNKDLCKGCLLCTTVCPKTIIIKADAPNEKGYYPASVPKEDLEKCKQCKFCTLICPEAAISVKLKGDK